MNVNETVTLYKISFEGFPNLTAFCISDLLNFSFHS